MFKGVARLIKVRGLRKIVSELRCVQFLCAEYALLGGLVPRKFLKLSCLRLNLLAILAKSLLEMYCSNK